MLSSPDHQTLANLTQRLDNIETELRVFSNLLSHNKSRLGELVTMTLGVSLEISTYSKEIVRTSTSTRELASLLKRQSTLLRAICKLQRHHMNLSHTKSRMLMKAS